MLYYENNNNVAPCLLPDGVCKFGKPVLWLSNHLAMEMFNKIQTQIIIAGMGEPLGLNQQAIINILDIYGITNQEERKVLFDKILAIDNFRMKKMIEKKEKAKKDKK